MPSAADRRKRLVTRLGIEDPRVRDAFLAVPRERFLPGLPLEQVYADDAIVTKRDEQGTPISSSSQPKIMALMLERLALGPGLRVLEVGAGTGYNAALLKTLVGPEGRVVSVDVDPELVASAARALDGSGVEVVEGDGRAGWPAAAPFDRILLSVSADAVTRAWRDQLVEGGLLELPLAVRRGEQVVATFRREGDRLAWVTAVPGGFMPLRGTRPAPEPTLHAGRSNGETHEPLVRLFGPGIGALSAEAAQRLLAVAAGKPRRVRLDTSLPRWELRTHLALSLPDARLVESPAGVGVVARDGRSLAVADTAWRRRARRTAHLLAWGGDEAERTLLRAIDRWRADGCPGVERLGLSIEFDGDASRIVR